MRKLQKLPVSRVVAALNESFGSPGFGQAQNGVLELDLGGVDKFRASKGGTATLRAEWKHDKSVTSAYWDPRGRSIVSTSYDDALRSTS